MDDDDKNLSQKAWTMEMLTNGGDILTNTRNEEESMTEDEKKFLHARAVHSNHLIQHHMHQIMERQRVVDEYRNMTMEGMNLIPLESNLHKSDSVIISQIISKIEVDNFWHRKTFESVMSNLWNMWTEGIQKLENTHMHCTNNDENNNEIDGVYVINLCSASQSKDKTYVDRKESTKQESQDKSKHNTVDKMKVELRSIKSKSMTKNKKVESAMMCWESALARMMVKKLNSMVMDVETAFLYGDIEEEIFMKSPVGMEEMNPGSSPEDCYQLKKGIYGLFQAARQFRRKFVDTIKKEPFGFTISPAHP